MKAEISLNPNCSEAVFRFHTVKPKEIQIILQAIADEITHNSDFSPHKNKVVSLLADPRDYDSQKSGVLLQGCAGLGYNDAVVTVENDSFVLNIGNNDISENTTKWVEKVNDLNIKVDQAEDDTEAGKELVERARDCTCGITWDFKKK